MAKKNKKRSNDRTSAIDSQGERFVTMPESFMRALLRQTTNNPKTNAGKKSYSYQLRSRDDIVGWLQAPATGTNEKNLRDASNFMYISSMHYNRLLNYYAGLYTGTYVISPFGFNAEEAKGKEERYAKQFRKVAKSLELMNVPSLLRFVMLVALRDGAFYGVLVSDKDSSIILKIDADYCKITSICDGSYLYKVDMTKIANKLEYYPPEFTVMYNRYRETGDQWQEVPIETSVCIKADDTIPDYTIPPFAAVMPSLYSIANEEALQETASELRNYKMLAGQIPSDDKGNPLMSQDIVDKYYNHIANALSENVGLALSPFKLESISFDSNGGLRDINTLSDAVANFWSTAGTSGLLHGGENNTSGVTQLAIKNDETYVYGMVQQFERVMNRHLKTNFTGSIKFKISILPVTVFNRGEMCKYYKEAASFGIGKSYYAAAVGIPQTDVAGLCMLEKSIVPFEQLTPLKSSYTTSSNDEPADPGRPESEVTELGDEGMKTRDNDTNANRGTL